MGLTKSEWENHFVYEGWILAAAAPTQLAPGGRLAYRLRVGFSDEESVEVIAFRTKASERLAVGKAARVTGRLRFLPDETGRVLVRLDAQKVEILDLKQDEQPAS